MKAKFLFFTRLLMIAGGMIFPHLLTAQIATWHVHPEYDYIDLIEGSIIIAKKGGDFTFFKAEKGEEKVIETPSVKIKCAAMQDDCIVLTEAGTNIVYGFIKKNGEFVNLSGQGYKLPTNYPYFSDGVLLVATSEVVNQKTNECADLYQYIDKTGKRVYGPFANAKPFHNGFAAVVRYKNIDKNLKDLCYDYISSDLSIIPLPSTDRNDINFASSLDDNGESIIVLNKKAYKCKISTDEWTPLYTEDVENMTEKEKKKLQVVTASNRINLREESGYAFLEIKQGELVFDETWNIRAIRYNGQDEKIIPVKTKETYQPSSSLKVSQEKDGLYGLTYKSDLLLPEQFEKVNCCDGNLAVVKFKGKYGVLKVHPDDKFIISVNDGKGNDKGIGFKHRTEEAKLELLFPVYIDPAKVRLEAINGVNECKIKAGSRQKINNEETNGLTYDCTITIPHDELPSDYTTCKPYNFQVVYDCLDGLKDGLISKSHEVCINEWYIKLYDVEIKEPNFDVDITQDNIRIFFELKRSSMANDEDYANFFNVEVSSEKGENVYNCIQESSSKYYFDMPIGNKKLLKFEIRVFEDGCPPNIYPHTISVDFTENGEGQPQGTKKTVSISKTRKTEPKKTNSSPANPKVDHEWDEIDI